MQRGDTTCNVGEKRSTNRKLHALVAEQLRRSLRTDSPEGQKNLPRLTRKL